MRKSILEVGAALIFTSPTFASDISIAAKDGICRTSLARVNANDPAEYKKRVTIGDSTEYASAKGYEYYCEVFSDGKAFTLSSPAWGRLKPTGSVTTEGKCSNIKLFDPGFGVTHSLKFCSK